MYLSDLVEKNILAIGQNAKDNPSGFEIQHFAAGIANKDYPAQTPKLWNFVYQKLGMDERNIRLFGDPANFETIIAAMREDPLYIGGDIGVGFKDKAWKLVDRVEASARVMESINVICKQNARLYGYNTDGRGYVKSLKGLMRETGRELNPVRMLEHKRALILGAGGTGSSIGVALAGEGAEVIILNRTSDKAQALAARINKYYGNRRAVAGGRDEVSIWANQVDVVIVAIDDPDSPLYQYSGLGQIRLPITPENLEANQEDAKQVMNLLRDNVIVSDVMLRDGDTATIREAKKMGFMTLDGRPMVRNQAIEAFWLVNRERLEALGVTDEKVSALITEASQS